MVFYRGKAGGTRMPVILVSVPRFLSFVAKNVAAVSYRAGFFVTAGA